jgi:hypothetical protein
MCAHRVGGTGGRVWQRVMTELRRTLSGIDLRLITVGTVIGSGI